MDHARGVPTLVREIASHGGVTEVLPDFKHLSDSGARPSKTPVRADPAGMARRLRAPRGDLFTGRSGAAGGQGSGSAAHEALCSKLPPLTLA